MASHCCILLDDNRSSYLKTNMLLANRVKGRKKSEEVGIHTPIKELSMEMRD